jgi:hypothetical protein
VAPHHLPCRFRGFRVSVVNSQVSGRDGATQRTPPGETLHYPVGDEVVQEAERNGERPDQLGSTGPQLPGDETRRPDEREAERMDDSEGESAQPAVIVRTRRNGRQAQRHYRQTGGPPHHPPPGEERDDQGSLLDNNLGDIAAELVSDRTRSRRRPPVALIDADRHPVQPGCDRQDRTPS